MEGIYLGHIGRLASAENCDFVLDVSVISFGVVQQLIASSSLVSQLRLGAPPAPQAVAHILCRCRRHNDQRGQLEELYNLLHHHQQDTTHPPCIIYYLCATRLIGVDGYLDLATPLLSPATKP
jgi:hypothetical protein